MVSGTTQVVAVIGHPIAQVKSPDNFNRYFAEQHMDSVMIPVDIDPDAVAAYLNALRGWQNMTGVLVTVPHNSAPPRWSTTSRRAPADSTPSM